jgi:hypothetical protein
MATSRGSRIITFEDESAVNRRTLDPDSCNVSQTAGTTKANEPGSHMIAPATA